MKNQVFKNNPQSISELKDEIFGVIKNVIENFNKRVDLCRAARGGHLADNIFCI